ncbi:MAG: GMC family oxidoreductase [Leptospirales bacterium]|nr:GMC family oxidoreductase [Leptospirales bacterium]
MKLKNRYDYIIIGSGFGGAMAAYTLAKKDKSILIVDRGKWPVRDDSCWDEIRLHIKNPMYRGETPFYVDQKDSKKDAKIDVMWPDDTVGGMSTLYGAVSFRMREEDFLGAPAPEGNERESSSAWPYTYKNLEPYYAKAEKLLGIAGIKGKDITEPPIKTDYLHATSTKLSRPSKKLWAASEKLGLHPFFLPMAINFSGMYGENRCILCSTCDHYLCKIKAKNDLAAIILPVTAEQGVHILSETRALKIKCVKNRAAAVDLIDQKNGAKFSVRCDHIILSGGALYSPHLLLASGIDKVTGNDSIGRYLMRHANGVVAGIFPSRSNPEKVLQKQIGIPDYYHGDPNGIELPAGAWGMIQDVSSIGKGVIKANAPFGLKNMAAIVSDYLINLLCIAEDTPQYENRVYADFSQRDKYDSPLLKVYHRYSERDINARNALYSKAKTILRKAGALFFYTMPIETFSHGLGTCRMGKDASNSVVDANCKVHGMENLYVIDGSVMPSGGSVNPSLTIAALSIKAAERLR